MEVRIRFIATAAIVAAFGATGVTAQQLTGVLKKIKDTGEITIGYDEIDVDDVALLSDELRLNPTAVESGSLVVQEHGRDWLRVLMDMDTDGLREAALTQLRDDLYRIAREGKIPFSGLAMRDGGVEIKIADGKFIHG